MTIVRFFITVLFIALLDFAGCFVHFPPDYVEFRELPKHVQAESFKSLSIEKQLEYFEYCWTATTCDESFSETITGQGNTVLPYLLNKMDGGEDWERFVISSLLEKMHTDHVRIDDYETKSKLRAVLSKMNDLSWKALTEDRLSAILNPPQ